MRRRRSADGGAAHMHDRHVVGIDALPFAHAVEQAYGGRRRIEQGRGDAVLVEQVYEVADVPQGDGAIMPNHECLAVELIGAPVDERLDPRVDEVAAEVIIVENGTGVARLED